MGTSRWWRSAALAVVSVMGVGACGTSHTRPAAAPAPVTTTLLHRSRALLDATPSVHFALSSAGVASSTTAITGGGGDLVRPDRLRGSFAVEVGGFGAMVAVVETGGIFYAKPPFQPHYSVTKPSAYGLGDPAQLLRATNGVSSLLTTMTGVRTGGQVRVGGELLDVVSGEVPGSKVPVLPDLAPSKPVLIVAEIDPASDQLRQVRLSGPFTAAASTTTYTVTLTAYGEKLAITAPTT